MAHYAFIDSNNIVVEIIKGRDEDDLVEGVTSWEEYYEQFRPGLKCKRTSFNTFEGMHRSNGTPFRKNYAGIGYVYDESRDAFIPPKAFDSWVLNEETCLWNPPIPRPVVEGKNYLWNEETKAWDEIS